jgi:hypothetical protein
VSGEERADAPDDAGDGRAGGGGADKGEASIKKSGEASRSPRLQEGEGYTFKALEFYYRLSVPVSSADILLLPLLKHYPCHACLNIATA